MNTGELRKLLYVEDYRFSFRPVLLLWERSNPINERPIYWENKMRPRHLGKDFS
jgi:hypothetical protein